MKKSLAIITILGIVTSMILMFFAFSTSAKNGDPWENNIIHVTSSADNFVTPPGISGSGHANYTTSGGGYSFTEGKYAASTSALPEGYTLFSIMKTDPDKVPLKVGPDQEYTISFDWKNLYNGPAPAEGQLYNGQVELRAYGVASGEIFRDTFLAAGARTAGQSGKISKTVNFSVKDPSWLSGTPAAGDDVYLYLYGANIQGFEISNFIITNKDYNPWKNGIINVSAESCNFVTPPGTFSGGNYQDYTAHGGGYSFSDGKYTAATNALPVGYTIFNIMKTNINTVPLKIGSDQEYTISFDWKNLYNGPAPAEGQLYNGQVELRAYGAASGEVFRYTFLAAGARTAGQSGKVSKTVNFSVKDPSWLGGNPTAGDDVYLYLYGANVQGFEISNFIITNKDYNPPDPWENDMIDVTSSADNFITPPTDWYPGVGYPFPYVNYNWEPGKYTASEIGARKAGTYQSPQTVILQTNPERVPLTFDKEDDKYTFTFDWKITGLGGVWVHLFQITSPTAGNQVKALITQLGSDGSRSGTTTFTVTQADIPAAYRAVKDIRLYFSGVSDKVTGFEISNFTVANKEYAQPDLWENDMIDVTSNAGNFITPPGGSYQNYTAHGGGYSLADDKYTAATSALPAGYTIFNIMKTNPHTVPLKFGPDQKYTISFDWKNLYDGPAPAEGQLYNGQVELRAYGAGGGIVYHYYIMSAGARKAGEAGNYCATIDFSKQMDGIGWLGGAPAVGDSVYLYLYGANIQGFEISNFTIANKDYVQPDPWENDVIDVTSDIGNFAVPGTISGHISYLTSGGSYSVTDGTYAAKTSAPFSGGVINGIMKTNPVKVPLKFGPGNYYQIDFNWNVLNDGPVPTSAAPYSGMVELRAYGVNGGTAYNFYILNAARRLAGESGTYSATLDFTRQTGGIALWPDAVRPAVPAEGDDVYLYIYGVDIQGFSISNFTIKKADGPGESEAEDINDDPWDFYDRWSDWEDILGGDSSKWVNSIVYGYLTNENGDTLNGVSLVLESDEGNLIETVTESDGYFEFMSVPPGHYKLYLLDEYGDMIWSGLEVEVGERRIINISAVYDGTDFTGEIISTIKQEDYFPETGDTAKTGYLVLLSVISAVIVISTVRRRKKRVML